MSGLWFFYCAVTMMVILCGQSEPQKIGIGSGSNGNLRVCVVEGKGLYKKAGRYCPVLDKNNSGVECVIGTDRLDCLRRISKGSVDFGVFSSEDLLTARWENIDVLITDELRFHDEPFEYEVVAITDNDSHIYGLEGLRGSRLCHPGHGYEADWTDTLANFLESKIIPRSCDPLLSLFENRLKSSAEFFSGACKAGPWVADKIRDRTLKSLYPSLCSQCYDPASCASSDKYWGRRGPLHCLTEGAGDIAWARYDDTKIHFGLVGNLGLADPSMYSYLCSDGTKQSLINNTSPCVWISKPWPVIAAKRKTSKDVSLISRQLSHAEMQSWQSALLSLLEPYHAKVIPLHPPRTVQEYLHKAVGFQSANSFAECTPPRSIVLCTSSIVERHKCDWLAETARAHGLEPQLQCVLHTSSANSSSPLPPCLEAVRKGDAEVAIAMPDWQIQATRDFGLEVILHEVTPIMNDLHIVTAIVKKNSSLHTLNDLVGHRACFPLRDGVAWTSAILRLGKGYTCLQNIFSEVCPSLADGPCPPGGLYDGELGALRCLVDGKADVAFISINTLRNISDIVGTETWAHNLKSEDFVEICDERSSQNCFVSWSSIGQVYMQADTSTMRRQELVNTFKQLNLMFGKGYKSQTAAFTMYGPFDHKNNVLFQDKTKYMRTLSEMTDSRLPFNYELMMKDFNFAKCDVPSRGFVFVSSSYLTILTVIYLFYVAL